MLDAKQLKRRVLLRTLGNPATVLPVLVGMTAMTAGWVLDWQSGVSLFAGLAGVLAGAGAFVTQLLVRGGRISEEVTTEMREEEGRIKQRALDDLDRLLTEADDDPRPETALRDLRALLTAFRESGAGLGTAAAAIDIQSMVSQLFDQCVRSLRQTADLWDTARQLTTPAAKAPILEQRERVIRDVQGSIRQLSDALVSLRTLGQGNGSTHELRRYRDELDQSLAMAKRVEERLSAFVSEAHVTARGSERFPVNTERKEE